MICADYLVAMMRVKWWSCKNDKITLVFYGKNDKITLIFYGKNDKITPKKYGKNDKYLFNKLKINIFAC